MSYKHVILMELLVLNCWNVGCAELDVLPLLLEQMMDEFLLHCCLQIVTAAMLAGPDNIIFNSEPLINHVAILHG